MTKGPTPATLATMSSQHATEPPLDGTTGATDRAAEAAADAIVPEISLVSASAAPTRAARGADGRFMRVVGAATETVEDGLPSDRFLDREISWLQFNERVLQLAADPTMPLLERARYLAIFTSNLDEFFMVRVAGLKRRIATGIAVRSASGLEPREVLEQISFVAHELLDARDASQHRAVVCVPDPREKAGVGLGEGRRGHVCLLSSAFEFERSRILHCKIAPLTAGTSAKDAGLPCSGCIPRFPR